jgi:hypothetical protein
VSTYLRALGMVVLVVGLIVCLFATRAALGDDAYYRAAFALERHADNVLFQAEYQFALSRHAALIAVAAVSGVGAVVGSALLLAMGSIMRLLERQRTAPVP